MSECHHGECADREFTSIQTYAAHSWRTSTSCHFSARHWISQNCSSITGPGRALRCQYKLSWKTVRHMASYDDRVSPYLNWRKTELVHAVYDDTSAAIRAVWVKSRVSWFMWDTKKSLSGSNRNKEDQRELRFSCHSGDEREPKKKKITAQVCRLTLGPSQM